MISSDGAHDGTWNPDLARQRLGCEVQLIPSPPVSQVSSDPAEDAFRLLLSTLGLAESSRPELDKTPARAAKAFREMPAGLRVQDPLWLGLRTYNAFLFKKFVCCLHLSHEDLIRPHVCLGIFWRDMSDSRRIRLNTCWDLFSLSCLSFLFLLSF